VAKKRVAQAALDRALDEKDLLLVYQPIHDARTREIVSVEGLLRQRRKNGQIREASVITETAEKGPEVFELELWTIKHALQDAMQWQSGIAAHVKVNVNISPRIFEQGSGSVLDRMTEMTGECGIDSANVNIEMTETSYIEDPKDTMYALKMMRERGFNLWLDDFGTGHSSIEHLQLFPLDGIKIPGSFVKGIAKDERCRTIVRTLVHLAHDLGLKVVAEGIERKKAARLSAGARVRLHPGLLVLEAHGAGGFREGSATSPRPDSPPSTRLGMTSLPVRERRAAHPCPSSRPS
jgi:EAL domain-containing protein (putative c-di-GMP-specific phosphodiesterase class I)